MHMKIMKFVKEIKFKFHLTSQGTCLQCFDTVGWVAERESDP